MQSMPSGDNAIQRNIPYDNDRGASSSQQFVVNPSGFGSRSNPKRSTFIRTKHVDASADDLAPNDQQQEYNQTSSNLSAPQQIRSVSHSHRGITSMSPNESNTRPRLIHGAPNSQNSSGHDSGLSSGGASFDPEQHPIYNLGNQTYSNRSGTPAIESYEVPPPIPIPKRKSLPSIVKANSNDYKVDETARSSDHLPGKETFIIENGIRKRVTEQPPTYTESGSLVPQASVMTSSSGSPILARRILLESVTKLDPSAVAGSTSKPTAGGGKRGSMPTLVNIARHRQEAPSKNTIHFSRQIFSKSTKLCFFFTFYLAISREEASMLGSRRREELRRQRDFDSTMIGRVKNLLQVRSIICIRTSVHGVDKYFSKH